MAIELDDEVMIAAEKQISPLGPGLV